MIKVGVIGCGMITQHRHAPEYHENEFAQLAGWYDAIPDKAESMAERYGGKIYLDWREMIDGGGLDAVSVCSPNATHAEIAIYALKHGLHVLCEKPMATTLNECERMVQAAEACGKLLFIGQNQRLVPAHIKARELISSGAIGDVLTFRTSFGHAGPEVWTKSSKTWFYNKSVAAFGAVFDLGIHKVDLMNFLLDDTCVQVGAMLGTLDKKFEDGTPITVDDNACVLVRTKKGRIGQLTASWTYYGSEDNSTTIWGTKGTLHILEDEDSPLFLTTEDSRTDYSGLGGMQTNADQFNSGIIDAFITDIKLGREATISGASVFQAMRTVFAAAESAQLGRFVEVEM